MKKIFTFFLLLFTFLLSFAKGDMTIGGNIYSVDTLSHMKVGPGAYYTSVRCEKGSVRLNVYYLEIDAKNPYVEFKSALSCDSLVGTEYISHIASRKSVPGFRYFAGTNADFFATSGAVGTPVYGGTVDGEIANVYNGSPQALFDKDQFLYIAQTTFSGSVIAGENSYSIDNVNAARYENNLILYNHNMGNYTRTNSYGYEILVKPLEGEQFCVNTATRVKILSSSSNGNMRIEPGCVVLSGHGTAAEFLKTLQTNDEIEIKTGLTLSLNNIQPPIQSAVGGDRAILRDGNVLDPDWADRHPRTSIGHNADRSKVYMCVVDGRGASAGVSTKHLADIMKFAGATDAMNLDGGGSSGMYIEKYGIMNVPSDGKERAVGNGIFVVSTAPDDDNIAEILCKTQNVTLPKNGVFTPEFLGYNQYGYLINTDVTGVKLSCDESLGYIKDNSFVASGSGNGNLKASYNGIETTISVEIGGEYPMALRLDSVINDGCYEYPIEVLATVNDKSMPVLSSAFDWTVEHPDICMINDGVLKGINDGVTDVYCKYKSFEDTLKVKVMMPKGRIMAADDFSDISSWTVTSNASKDCKLVLGNSGAEIQYTYSGGRAPYVQMEKSFELYSLPDTFKIVRNTGVTQVTRASLMMKNNSERNFDVLEYSSIPVNEDYQIVIPMDQYLSNPMDMACYPIHFQSLKFLLNASSQASGNQYTLKIKDFSLIYGDYELNAPSVELASSLIVYPNPADRKDSFVYLKLTEDTKLKAELYDMDGKLLKVLPENLVAAGVVSLPVDGLGSGTYILKITRDGKTDSVKIIKR